MRVLVTGGAGFIGSHVVERLLGDGHTILVVDDLRNGLRSNLDPRACFLELDIASPRMTAEVQTFQPEAILHFAAQIDVRSSCEDPVADAEENILATLRLLEAGRRCGLQYFLFASSGGAIYGEASEPQTEAHVELPINPYGVAKLAVDKYLHAFSHQYGLAGCSLRFSNVYGPRQGSSGEAGVVATFCKHLRRGEPPRIHGKGDQTRDFVFAPDVAQAVHGALLRKATGVFNISTCLETPILELGRLLCLEAGMDPSALRHDAAIPGEQRRSVMDYGKAQRELGWIPETTLREGLARTFRWFMDADPHP